MKRDDKISEEQLNAFIDGELVNEDRDRVFEAINGDAELKAAVCEIRTVRELVRHAYGYQELDAQPSCPSGLGIWGRAIAASLLLACGGLVGWVTHEHSAQSQLQAMFWNEQSTFQNASIVQASAEQGYQKVLVHLNTSNLAKIEEALNTAEQLLENYAQTEQAAEMEIVANSGGLNLLRAGHSPTPSACASCKNAM